VNGLISDRAGQLASLLETSHAADRTTAVFPHDTQTVQKPLTWPSDRDKVAEAKWDGTVEFAGTMSIGYDCAVPSHMNDFEAVELEKICLPSMSYSRPIS
jgi:hypothetical protein